MSKAIGTAYPVPAESKPKKVAPKPKDTEK